MVGRQHHLFLPSFLNKEGSKLVPLSEGGTLYWQDVFTSSSFLSASRNLAQ